MDNIEIFAQTYQCDRQLIEDAIAVFQDKFDYQFFLNKYSLPSLPGETLGDCLLLQMENLLNSKFPINVLDCKDFPVSYQPLCAYLDLDNDEVVTIIYDRVWNRLLIDTLASYKATITELIPIIKSLRHWFHSGLTNWSKWKVNSTQVGALPIVLILDSENKLCIYTENVIADIKVNHQDRLSYGFLTEDSDNDAIARLVITLYGNIINKTKNKRNTSSVKDIIVLCEIKEHVTLNRDRKTGLAFIQDGTTGLHHTIHPNIDSTGSVSGMIANGPWEKDDIVLSTPYGHYNLSQKVITDDYDKIVAQHCLCNVCKARLVYGIQYTGQGVYTSLPIFASYEIAELFDYAIMAYGFLLNTPERIGKIHSWSEFADLIEAYYDNPRRKEVVAALRKYG